MGNSREEIGIREGKGIREEKGISNLLYKAAGTDRRLVGVAGGMPPFSLGRRARQGYRLDAPQDGPMGFVFCFKSS